MEISRGGGGGGGIGSDRERAIQRVSGSYRPILYSAVRIIDLHIQWVGRCRACARLAGGLEVW